MVTFLWDTASIASSNSSKSSIEFERETVGSQGTVLFINTRSHTDLGSTREDDKQLENYSFDISKESEDFYKTGVPRFHFVQLDVLKRSAGQDHKDWACLASIIQENYNNYIGFLVYNGTDNMVSTATALSFMLENLGKPVIFTGSSIPPGRLYTDLYRNLILALFFASCDNINEVCILFDDRLLRANRAVKLSRLTFAPFDSPHFPPLATMDGKITLHRPFLRLHPRGAFRVMGDMSAVVLCLKLGPSMRAKQLERALELTSARAIIIIAYGGGNAPSLAGEMTSLIKKTVDRGVIVVICSQNLYGVVDLGAYAAGTHLMEAGAISAREMTIDAAIMKLKYLFGVGLSTKEIKRIFSNVNLRGELLFSQAML